MPRNPDHPNLLAHGVPGNPGGGRTPDQFKRAMKAVAAGKKTLRYLQECAEGKHGASAAIQAQQYAAERGYGKVNQGVEGSMEFVVRIVEE